MKWIRAIVADSTVVDTSAYVSETVVLAAKQGSRKEEKLIAHRTSGFRTPIFAQAMYGMLYSAISFYNSSIPIFSSIEPSNRINNEYLTPLCQGSISIYNFTLENVYTSENQTDTIFEISYFPKKNTNIQGLQGTLFISSDGYALTRVIAQPYDKQGMDFYFKQEYQKTEGKWFPSNLEQIVRIGEFNIFTATMNLVYSIVSNNSDVSYSVGRKLPNRIEQLYSDEDSIKYNSTRFDSISIVPMTKRETGLYNKTDSLMTVMRKEAGFDFDDIINMITKLPDDNKIQINKFDISLGRIISQNQYEKTRWGLGLYTNEHLIKWLSVGGYFGYGTGDKRWKYGGSLEFTIQKSHDLKLKYQYQNTLKEVGKNIASNSVEWNDNYFRNLLSYRFDRATEHKIDVKYQPFRPLQLKAFISLKNIKPLYDYTYKGNVLSDFVSDDVNFSLRYAFNEKFSIMGNERSVFQTGNPIFNISYTRGINSFRATSPIYNKLEVSVDIRAYSGRIGQSNLHLAAGYIDKDLPYGLLFTGQGSRDKMISLLIPNTFQTMNPYEFLSDRYVNLFYSHNFGSLLLKTKHFRPEFVVAYNAGWGKLSHPENHDISFDQYNRIYQEAGLTVNKIVQMKIPFFPSAYFNIGIGGYVRIPDWKENPSLKMALSFSL